MISVTNISKSFGQHALWSNLSFNIDNGEMAAVVGPSGCGKSTLLNCLGLLEPVDSGEIAIDGQDVTRLRSRAQRRFRRATLGYLFQNYALIENATCNYNLGVAIARGQSDHSPTFEEALDAVGLGGRGKDMVYRLSGGEQQRLALARLIVKKARVILADEPTGALDSDNSDMVIGLLRRMAQDGCAIVIATHSKHVESSCDKSLTLGNGTRLRSPGSVTA